MPPRGGKGAFIKVFRREVNGTPLYDVNDSLPSAPG